YVGGIKLKPMIAPAFRLCCVAELDRRRQIRVVGPRSQLLDPTVINQQLALDDLGLAGRPGHALDAAMLCQPFAGRAHLDLAIDAQRIAAGIEQRLCWQPVVNRFIVPDIAGRPVDAAIRGRECKEIIELAHAFLPSTTSLKSQPTCLGTNAATVRPAAVHTCRQCAAAFCPSPFSSLSPSSRSWVMPGTPGGLPSPRLAIAAQAGVSGAPRYVTRVAAASVVSTPSPMTSRPPFAGHSRARSTLRCW